ncbi:MAG: hypothetical protein JXA21_08800 [Anaerolineae bacterium]|nr:hypothetical protein [Anaerolineae bacterium]
MRKGLVWVITFILLMLACNMPGISGSGSTPTPVIYVTVLIATPSSENATTSTSLPELTVTLTPGFNATTTPSVTLTPTATHTITPTPTSKGPTATPTFAPLGPPLGFGDPAWELVEWHEIADTNEWEGIIRIHAVGGVPPYRYQIEDRPASESSDVAMRWRLCKPMPGTIRVRSADGQEAHTSIWVWELGCKD